MPHALKSISFNYMCVRPCRFGAPPPDAGNNTNATVRATQQRAPLPQAPASWTHPLRIVGLGADAINVFVCCACYHEYAVGSRAPNGCGRCERPMHPACGIDEGTALRDRRAVDGICDSCNIQAGNDALPPVPIRMNKIVPVHLRPKDAQKVVYCLCRIPNINVCAHMYAS